MCACAHARAREKQHIVGVLMCSVGLDCIQSLAFIIALQVDLPSNLLQINSSHQELLNQARTQLDSIPTAHKLYTASKDLAISRELTLCKEKLDTLSVQCKFESSAVLEADSKLWNRLLLRFHPGQLSLYCKLDQIHCQLH